MNILDFRYKITSKQLTQGYRYQKLRQTLGKFFRSYSELLSKFREISFQEYISEGITKPVFCDDVVYKLRRVKEQRISSHRIRKIRLLVTPSTSNVWISDHREDYRSCSRPSTDISWCTLYKKAVATTKCVYRTLPKPSQRRQGTDPRPFWLFVGTPSALDLSSLTVWTEHSLLWRMSLDLSNLLFYHLRCLCIDLRPPIWLAVGPRSL